MTNIIKEFEILLNRITCYLELLNKGEKSVGEVEEYIEKQTNYLLLKALKTQEAETRKKVYEEIIKEFEICGNYSDPNEESVCIQGKLETLKSKL